MFERVVPFEETVRAYADFLSDERCTALYLDMKQHPEEYSAYHECDEAVAKAERILRAKLGEHQELLTTLLEAINLRGGEENELIYKLGFMDGGRVYHGFITHELPPTLSPQKEGNHETPD